MVGVSDNGPVAANSRCVRRSAEIWVYRQSKTSITLDSPESKTSSLNNAKQEKGDIQSKRETSGTMPTRGRNIELGYSAVPISNASIFTGASGGEGVLPIADAKDSSDTAVDTQELLRFSEPITYASLGPI